MNHNREVALALLRFRSLAPVTVSDAFAQAKESGDALAFVNPTTLRVLTTLNMKLGDLPPAFYAAIVAMQLKETSNGVAQMIDVLSDELHKPSVANLNGSWRIDPNEFRQRLAIKFKDKMYQQARCSFFRAALQSNTLAEIPDNIDNDTIISDLQMSAELLATLTKWKYPYTNELKTLVTVTGLMIAIPSLAVMSIPVELGLLAVGAGVNAAGIASLGAKKLFRQRLRRKLDTVGTVSSPSHQKLRTQRDLRKVAKTISKPRHRSSLSSSSHVAGLSNVGADADASQMNAGAIAAVLQLLGKSPFAKRMLEYQDWILDRSTDAIPLDSTPLSVEELVQNVHGSIEKAPQPSVTPNADAGSGPSDRDLNTVDDIVDELGQVDEHNLGLLADGTLRDFDRFGGDSQVDPPDLVVEDVEEATDSRRDFRHDKDIEHSSGKMLPAPPRRLGLPTPGDVGMSSESTQPPPAPNSHEPKDEQLDGFSKWLGTQPAPPPSPPAPNSAPSMGSIIVDVESPSFYALVSETVLDIQNTVRSVFETVLDLDIPDANLEQIVADARDAGRTSATGFTNTNLAWHLTIAVFLHVLRYMYERLLPNVEGNAVDECEEKRLTVRKLLNDKASADRWNQFSATDTVSNEINLYNMINQKKKIARDLANAQEALRDCESGSRATSLEYNEAQSRRYLEAFKVRLANVGVVSKSDDRDPARPPRPLDPVPPLSSAEPIALELPDEIRVEILAEELAEKGVELAQKDKTIGRLSQQRTKLQDKLRTTMAKLIQLTFHRVKKNRKIVDLARRCYKAENRRVVDCGTFKPEPPKKCDEYWQDVNGSAVLCEMNSGSPDTCQLSDYVCDASNQVHKRVKPGVMQSAEFLRKFIIALAQDKIRDALGVLLDTSEHGIPIDRLLTDFKQLAELLSDIGRYSTASDDELLNLTQRRAQVNSSIADEHGRVDLTNRTVNILPIGSVKVHFDKSGNRRIDASAIRAWIQEIPKELYWEIKKMGQRLEQGNISNILAVSREISSGRVTPSTLKFLHYLARGSIAGDVHGDFRSIDIEDLILERTREQYKQLVDSDPPNNATVEELREAMAEFERRREYQRAKETYTEMVGSQPPADFSVNDMSRAMNEFVDAGAQFAPGADGFEMARRDFETRQQHGE